VADSKLAAILFILFDINLDELDEAAKNFLEVFQAMAASAALAVAADLRAAWIIFCFFRTFN
jgi:hypothetical protein